MFARLQEFAHRIKTTLAFIVLFIVGYISFAQTSFIYSSWYPVIVQNEIISSIIKLLLGLCLFSLLVVIVRKTPVKSLLFLIIMSNVFGVVLRTLVLISFKNYPVHDSWHMLHNMNLIFMNDLSPFAVGGYFSMYNHQLNLVTLFSPLVSMFGYDTQPIFVFQLIMMQLSIIFLVISIYLVKGKRSAFFLSVLLNIFLPNFPVIFLFYGDLYSLFLLSFAILLLSIKTSIKKLIFLKYFFIYLFLTLAFFARFTSGIFYIAVIILLLIHGNVTRKKIYIFLLLTSIFIVPGFLNQEYYKLKYSVELGEHSLPSNTWFRVGTSFSSLDESSAGFFDVQVYRDFNALNFNNEKMQILNYKVIKDQLQTLAKDWAWIDFLETKLSIAWADPDFEMTTLLLPFSGQIFDKVTIDSPKDYYGTGAFDLVPTNGFGETVTNQYFNIRNIEKIMYQGLVFWTLISFIYNRKNKGIDLVQIALIGMFLYLAIFEVKSRYLWVFANLWMFGLAWDFEAISNSFIASVSRFKLVIDERKQKK